MTMGGKLKDTASLTQSLIEEVQSKKKNKKNKHKDIETEEPNEENLKRKLQAVETDVCKKKKKKHKKDRENGHDAKSDEQVVKEEEEEEEESIDGSKKKEKKKKRNKEGKESETNEAKESENGEAKQEVDSKVVVTGKGVEEAKYVSLKSFSDARLPENVLECCKNFKNPSPIQSHAWPFLLNGRDFIGIAKTGSGIFVFMLIFMRNWIHLINFGGQI